MLHSLALDGVCSSLFHSMLFKPLLFSLFSQEVRYDNVLSSLLILALLLFNSLLDFFCH